VEQELLTFLEHMCSPSVFSEVRVTRSLVLSVCFEDRCLSFCTFSVDHCVVCFSSIDDCDYLPLVSSNSSLDALFLPNSKAGSFTNPFYICQ
jgi:hypothetical protein